MRGWIPILLTILLVPSVAASTDIRSFRGEVDDCALMLVECSTSQEGTFQLDCQQGSCVVTLRVTNATYDGQAAATTKTLVAYGSLEGGSSSSYACRTQTTAKVARCGGTVFHTISLSTATCRRYDIISHATEQVARSEVNPTVRDIGFEQFATTSFQLCRSGSGSITVREA